MERKRQQPLWTATGSIPHYQAKFQHTPPTPKIPANLKDLSLSWVLGRGLEKHLMAL
jgi:hypothetical protein